MINYQLTLSLVPNYHLPTTLLLVGSIVSFEFAGMSVCIHIQVTGFQVFRADQCSHVWPKPQFKWTVISDATYTPGMYYTFENASLAYSVHTGLSLQSPSSNCGCACSWKRHDVKCQSWPNPVNLASGFIFHSSIRIHDSLGVIEFSQGSKRNY